MSTKIVLSLLAAACRRYPIKYRRPLGLVALVIYKAFITVLFSITALALLFTLNNYQALENIPESYTLESKYQIIDRVLDKILNLNPATLQFSGIAAGVYALVSAIEAVGLWYKRAWAHLLALLLVGIGIPPEIYELIRGVTFLKFIVFTINVTTFWYLQHLPKPKRLR